jgi:hypothetical protein
MVPRFLCPGRRSRFPMGVLNTEKLYQLSELLNKTMSHLRPGIYASTCIIKGIFRVKLLDVTWVVPDAVPLGHRRLQ